MMTAVIGSERATSDRFAIVNLKTAWALALGTVSGLACVAVRLIFRLLQWMFLGSAGLLPEAASHLSRPQRVLLPVAGALCATAVLWAARRWASMKPAVDYVEAVRLERGRIPFLATLWRTVSSAFSLATGASVGREGSMIQFAAGVTSWLGARSPIRSIPLSRQVAYGAAAAVAAAYQAPIAGVFFALEIVLGEWLWSETLPLAAAALAGWLVSRLILGAGPLFAVHQALPRGAAVLWMLPLALLLGCCGPLYQKLLRATHVAGRLPLPLLWSGLAVGLLGLVRTPVWGNGDAALLDILRGNEALVSVMLVLALRVVATALCVGTGTVGGVFTPTLFTGAALGLISAHIVHSPAPVLLAIVGLSTLLAAVTHAPWMATFMTLELTGQYHLVPWLLFFNLLAWTVARHISPHSLYAIATPDPAA